MPFCTDCGDQFALLEGERSSDDPSDEVNFCSYECFERFQAALDAEEICRQAGWPSPAL